MSWSSVFCRFDGGSSSPALSCSRGGAGGCIGGGAGGIIGGIGIPGTNAGGTIGGTMIGGLGPKNTKNVNAY